MRALFSPISFDSFLVKKNDTLDKYEIIYNGPSYLCEAFMEVESEKMFNDFLILGELVEQSSRVKNIKYRQANIKEFLLECLTYTPKIEQYIYDRLNIYGRIDLPIIQNKLYLINVLEYCYSIYLLRYLFRLKCGRVKNMPKLFKWADIDVLGDTKQIDGYIMDYYLKFEEVSITTRLEPYIISDYDIDYEDTHNPNIEEIGIDIIKVWNRFCDPINYEVQEMIKTNVSTEYRNDETTIIERHCNRCGRLIKMSPNQFHCNPNSKLIETDEERLLAQSCFNKFEAKRKAEARERKKQLLENK